MESWTFFQRLLQLPIPRQSVASPDGSYIALFRQKGETVDLCIHEITTNTTRQISDGDVPQAVGKTERMSDAVTVWHPDEDSLFFTRAISCGQLSIARTTPTGESITTVVSCDVPCVVWDISPDGNLLYYLRGDDLYRRDLRSGRDEHVFSALSFVPSRPGGCSPDGEQLVFTVEGPGELNHRVRVTDADGDGQRTLDISAGDPVVAKAWHPDSQHLLVADDPYGYGGGRCGIYDLETDSLQWLHSDSEGEMPVCFVRDGAAVLVQEVPGTPVIYSVDGERYTLPFSGTAYFDHKISDGYRLDPDILVIPTESHRRPQHLARYRLANHRSGVLVDSVPDDIDTAALCSPEPVTYRGADNQRIESLLFDSGRRPSPVVVTVYGNRPRWSNSFRPWVQYLLKNGYSVLLATHPGPPFTDEERLNHAAAAEWLRSLSWTDDERIVIYGHSFGGYGVYMQMVRHPERWSAGIASAGPTDLGRLHEELLEQSVQIQSIIDSIGPREENSKLWERQSPINYIDELEGPLLAIHGTDDSAVPVEQARIFRDKLNESGSHANRGFYYHEIPGQGHGLQNSAECPDYWRRITDFLDTLGENTS